MQTQGSDQTVKLHPGQHSFQILHFQRLCIYIHVHIKPMNTKLKPHQIETTSSEHQILKRQHESCQVRVNQACIDPDTNMLAIVLVE